VYDKALHSATHILFGILYEIRKKGYVELWPDISDWNGSQIIKKFSAGVCENWLNDSCILLKYAYEFHDCFSFGTYLHIVSLYNLSFVKIGTVRANFNA
jgi:hypothetical protein